MFGGVTGHLGIAGLVCLGVVLGWLGALVTREASVAARLLAAGAAVSGAVVAAVLHAAWSRGVAPSATAIGEGMIAVAGVGGGWFLCLFWVQCLRAIVARARSNGVPHAHSRR